MMLTGLLPRFPCPRDWALAWMPADSLVHLLDNPLILLITFLQPPVLALDGLNLHLLLALLYLEPLHLFAQGLGQFLSLLAASPLPLILLLPLLLGRCNLSHIVLAEELQRLGILSVSLVIDDLGEELPKKLQAVLIRVCIGALLLEDLAQGLEPLSGLVVSVTLLRDATRDLGHTAALVLRVASTAEVLLLL